MSKKVVVIDGNEGRAIVGPNVNRRKGKGLGTGKLNRQSSQDRWVCHRV